MHLAEKGHNVTVLEKSHKLAKDAPPLQFYSMFQEAWEKLPNFRGIIHAECTTVSADGVTYIDMDGNEQTVKAGSIVIAAGMQPKNEEALVFAQLNKKLFLIGDCHTIGNVQTAVRSGYGAAYML